MLLQMNGVDLPASSASAIKLFGCRAERPTHRVGESSTPPVFRPGAPGLARALSQPCHDCLLAPCHDFQLAEQEGFIDARGQEQQRGAPRAASQREDEDDDTDSIASGDGGLHTLCSVHSLFAFGFAYIQKCKKTSSGTAQVKRLPPNT